MVNWDPVTEPSGTHFYLSWGDDPILSYVSNRWEKNKRDFVNFSSLFETAAFQILLTKTLEMYGNVWRLNTQIDDSEKVIYIVNMAIFGVSTGAGWSLTVSIAHVVMNSRCLFDFQTLGESHDFAGHVAADAGQRRHRMHGTWYIYLHWPYESTKRRYIFPYMDPMGSLGKQGVQRLFWKTCIISIYI